MHQNPESDRYTSDEKGAVVDHTSDELELIAVSKRSTRLLPHATGVHTKLKPLEQEATKFEKSMIGMLQK